MTINGVNDRQCTEKLTFKNIYHYGLTTTFSDEKFLPFNVSLVMNLIMSVKLSKHRVQIMYHCDTTVTNTLSLIQGQ